MATSENKKTNIESSKFIFLWLFMGIMGRLIPHPANFTPMTNLCVFAGSKLSRLWAIVSMAVMILLSDVLLAIVYGYPIISYWSLFTYSGFLGITVISFRFSNLSCWQTLPFVLLMGFGFWFWTNFGVWLTSSIYAKTFSGVFTCYIAALPFLKNALLGDLVWFGVIFGGSRVVHWVRSRGYTRAAYRNVNP